MLWPYALSVRPKKQSHLLVQSWVVPSLVLSVPVPTTSPVHIHFVHWAKSEEQNSRNKCWKRWSSLVSVMSETNEEQHQSRSPLHSPPYCSYRLVPHRSLANPNCTETSRRAKEKCPPLAHSLRSWFSAAHSSSVRLRIEPRALTLQILTVHSLAAILAVNSIGRKERMWPETLRRCALWPYLLTAPFHRFRSNGLCSLHSLTHCSLSLPLFTLLISERGVRFTHPLFTLLMSEREERQQTWIHPWSWFRPSFPGPGVCPHFSPFRS